MKFKDVAHLYIGCMCEVSAFGGEFVEPLAGVKRGAILIGGNAIDVFAHPHFKPILRPLSDITEAEIDEYLSICKSNEGKSSAVYGGGLTYYLLSKYFDIYELIPAGEVLDATKLSNNPYKQL